jgi:hypothetical protein
MAGPHEERAPLGGKDAQTGIASSTCSTRNQSCVAIGAKIGFGAARARHGLPRLAGISACVARCSAEPGIGLPQVVWTGNRLVDRKQHRGHLIPKRLFSRSRRAPLAPLRCAAPVSLRRDHPEDASKESIRRIYRICTSPVDMVV